jgi:hypothetical protein
VEGVNFSLICAVIIESNEWFVCCGRGLGIEGEVWVLIGG